MSNKLHPIAIEMRVGQYEIEAIQHLTDMFFRGIVEGAVIVATTASGTHLLFTNAESATYVELEENLKLEYISSVGYISKRMNSAITDNAMWSGTSAVPSQYYTTTGANSISLNTNTVSSGIYNSGTP